MVVIIGVIVIIVVFVIIVVIVVVIVVDIIVVVIIIAVIFIIVFIVIGIFSLSNSKAACADAPEAPGRAQGAVCRPGAPHPFSFITSSRGGQMEQVVQPLIQDQVILGFLVL